MIAAQKVTEFASYKILEHVYLSFDSAVLFDANNYPRSGNVSDLCMSD